MPQMMARLRARAVSRAASNRLNESPAKICGKESKRPETPVPFWYAEAKSAVFTFPPRSASATVFSPARSKGRSEYLLMRLFHRPELCEEPRRCSFSWSGKPARGFQMRRHVRRIRLHRDRDR